MITVRKPLQGFRVSEDANLNSEKTDGLIDRASIVKNGKLSDRFEYLREYVGE